MAIEIKEFVGFKANTKKGAKTAPKFSAGPKGATKHTKGANRTGRK